MSSTRRPFLGALALCALLSTIPSVSALAQNAGAQGPLVTSSGQALDAFTVKTLLGRANVPHDYDPVATADKLTSRPAVIIAMGASVKGFGAAGITAQTELARTQAILDAAKTNKIQVIGVHIGGAERRGGASEQFIQLVSGAADRLVVAKEGNQDGYFSKLAEERKIPITVIDQPLQVGTTLAKELGQGS